jgi:Putative zinc-finger
VTTSNGGLDRLRRAFAAGTAASGADCPPASRLWEAVNGELDPADAAVLVDHVSACGACAEAWRIAHELQAEAAPAAVVPFVRERRASPVWPLLAAAATLVLAVAAWQLMHQAPVPAHPAQAAVTPSLKPEQTTAAIGPAIEKAPVVLSASRALVFRNQNAADPFVADFAAAIEPYRKDDYPEAITRLDGLARKYPDADEPPFYLGVSLLLASRRGDAVAPLRRAAHGRDQAIAEQARRYLVLATGR